MEWQDISTAPKDGTVVIVNDTADGGVAIARWLGAEAWSGWIYDDDLLCDSSPLGPMPTHWMPLPPPPSHKD